MKPPPLDWLVPSLVLFSVSFYLVPVFQGRFSAFASPASGADHGQKRRGSMVLAQIEARGVSDPRVLEAMRRVPRHRFVPPEFEEEAYSDKPLPIGHQQTISQPYIVAFMTEALRLAPGSRVLEIGTGSGYQAAVLAELGAEVYSIEIVPELARESAGRLKELGYTNILVKEGDGYLGWHEHAPFDAVILTAAPPELPGTLLDQLKPGGKLIAPVGRGKQELVLVTKTEEGLREQSLLPVRFVPMVTKQG